MRTEKDFIGEIALRDETLYGIQTARAVDNFSLHYKKTSPSLVKALVMVKKAAALAYEELEEKAASGKAEVHHAIAGACDHILAMETIEPLFPVDALQGGAGTSTNMNVNEVLANLALKTLGKSAGAYDIIHPIDHVNRGQSTNDVYPTALRIAAILALRSLSEQCAKLQESLQKKETSWSDIKKLGRTELMDATPVTLGEEFGAYAQAIGRDRWRLYKIEERLRQVNLGGVAVGNASNASNAERRYRFLAYEKLRELTGIGLAAAEYPMDITQNNDVFVEVSGLLKALSVNLSKIASDIRLMNAGPHGGIREITVQSLQMGSTIMPGKVNPVIPEMVIQTAIRVQANDLAITIAASRGEFELNAFLPLIADSLLESLCLLERAVLLFRTKCVETIAPNEDKCAALLDSSAAYAASLTLEFGYEEAERRVKERENR